MGGRCAVAVAVAAWLGLIAGRGLTVAPAALCLIGAAPFAWLALRAPPRVGTVAVLLAIVLAAAARGSLSRAALDHGPAALADDPPPRWIAARVVEHPLREGGEPLAIVVLTRASAPLPAGTRVRLRLPERCEAEIGDGLEALARLDRPPPRRNPGGLSSREIAATSGVAVQGIALAVELHPATGIAATARATVARWRRAIERCYARHLGAEAREIVTPLVIGDRSALPPALGAHLRSAGLTHLLALSGLHVVWLAGLARGAAAAAGRGVRGRSLAGAACALFYMGIAGPLPSLMRAVATELLLSAARWLGRALDPVHGLAMSVVALLAIAPGWADDLGFQLSCVATLGLVTIGPWLTERSGRRRRLAAPFVPTVAAQVPALPLLLDRFHALPWLTLAANLLAVPVCGLLLTAAWLAAGCECLFPGAGAPWFGACEVLAWALRAIAASTARVPGALLATGSEPALPWLAAAGAMLLVLALPQPRALDHALRPSHRRAAAAVAGAMAVVLTLALAVTARPLTPDPGRWWMVALDVGQGDAIALGFEDGWWLVDTGVRTPHVDVGEAVVLPFLRWAGVRRLERVALTHDDGDHTGGAPAVLRSMRVGALITPVAVPGVPGPEARFRGSGARLAVAARGDTLHRRPPIVVRWPPREVALPSDNAAALVLEAGEERARVLLAADLDSLREDSLDVAPGVAVLKVGHHGSGSSSGAAFLERVRPALAVLSVGRHNAFGHPDPHALERLRHAGARIVRTDRSGAIWLELSADGVGRIDWRRARPAGDERAAAERNRAALARSMPGW